MFKCTLLLLQVSSLTLVIYRGGGGGEYIFVPAPQHHLSWMEIASVGRFSCNRASPAPSHILHTALGSLSTFLPHLHHMFSASFCRTIRLLAEEDHISGAVFHSLIMSVQTLQTDHSGGKKTKEQHFCLQSHRKAIKNNY